MSKKINKILVPIDFAEHSLNIVEAAIRIAKKNNSELLVLHIIDTSVSLIDEIDNSFEEDWSINALMERAQTMLDGLKNSMEEKHKISMAVMVKSGLIASSVVGTARDRNIDLIVIGSYGIGDRAFFLGLNAYCIVKQTTCSVLTILEGKGYGAFTKILFPEQTMNDLFKKSYFLKKILDEKDITIEIPGLVKNNIGINITILNEIILLLGNKLIDDNIRSPYEFQEIVNSINKTMDNITIKLITIEERNMENDIIEYPINSEKQAYLKMPVFSITNL